MNITKTPQTESYTEELMDTEVTRLQKLRGYRNYGITEVTGLRKLHDNRNYGFTEVTIADVYGVTEIKRLQKLRDYSGFTGTI